MDFFKKLIFWIIFSLFTSANSLAQQEQTFRLQSVSYMRMAEGLQLSAAQGRPDAQTQLAEMYERGLGVPQNLYKAIDLYRKAALNGFEPAQIRLQSLGVGVLAESEAEIVDEAKVVKKSSTTPKMQITINVGNLNSSSSVFNVWSPHRIVLTRVNKKKRLTRHRPFMSVQRQSNRGLLSSGQRPRATFMSTRTNQPLKR